MINHCVWPFFFFFTISLYRELMLHNVNKRVLRPRHYQQIVVQCKEDGVFSSISRVACFSVWGTWEGRWWGSQLGGQWRGTEAEREWPDWDKLSWCLQWQIDNQPTWSLDWAERTERHCDGSESGDSCHKTPGGGVEKTKSRHVVHVRMAKITFIS